MEITFSKRKLLLTLLVLIALVGIGMAALKLSDHSLSRIAGFDSGAGAALAGTQTFYSVDFQESADRWTARLCQVSTRPACAYYQNAVAPFL